MVEGIGMTTKNPTVRGEVVGICEFVWGTGEPLGVGGEDGQVQNTSRLYQPQVYQGVLGALGRGGRILTGRPLPPPKLKITASSTGWAEQVLRRRGIWP